MSRRVRPLLCSVLPWLVLAVAVLTGCGQQSNLIPRDRAEQLVASLDTIQALIDNGSCDKLTAAIEHARQEAASLPEAVDPRLRERIDQGIANLRTQAPEDCEQAPVTTTETTPTATTPTTTETTTTATTPTEPQTTPTPTPTPTPEPTTPQPTTTTPPQTTPQQPDQSDGSGGAPSPDGGGDTGGVSPGDTATEAP